MHRCSDFHVNGALQIFYDDDDDDDDDDEMRRQRVPRLNKSFVQGVLGAVCNAALPVADNVVYQT